MLNIGRGKIPTQNEGKNTGNKGNHRKKYLGIGTRGNRNLGEEKTGKEQTR